MTNVCKPTTIRTVRWAVASFLSAVVLLYLGLIGLGQWYGDEYDDFAALADRGWGAILMRIRWSPRPVSEFLFCSYGSLVNRLHDSLIAPFLAVLWAGFLFAGLLTPLELRWKHSEEDFWPDLLVALALMAFFVAYGPIMEVFYWPAGAAAYLPTLSATLLLFLQVVRGRLATSRGRGLCSLCLLVAACSSETGATLVAGYAVILAIQSALTVRRTRPTSECFLAWWLAPGTISVVLLGVVRLYRYNIVERPNSAVSPALGHPFLSILAGGKELVLEMLGRTVHSGAWFGLGSILPSELLLAAGAGLCWLSLGRLPRTTRSQIAMLSAALLLGSLLTIAASEVHFGSVCCRQHEVIRRCWIVMSLTGFTIVLLNSSFTPYSRGGPVSPLIGPLLLCLAVLVVWHVTPLFKEYRSYGALRQATEQNFQSGFNPYDTEMIFLLQPPDVLIVDEQVPAGRYSLDSASPVYAKYILRFFRKQSIVFSPAKDWLGATRH